MFKLMDTLNPFKGNFSPKYFAEDDGGSAGTGEGEGTGTPPATTTFTFDPTIANHPIIAKYKGNPNEIGKALIEVQDLIGPEKIILPSKDANEEEWNKRVWSRLGRPEKADGYTLPTDLQIPKELPVSDILIKNFKDNAHKLGLLPQQVAGMYKWFMQEQIAGLEGEKTKGTQARNDAETKLRREWGAAFEQNVSLGEKVLNSFADPETVNFLKQNGLHNDPNFIKFLSKIGSAFSEDQLVGKPKSFTMTPEEAQEEISKIKGDLKGPYWIAEHPEHKAVVDKVLRLQEMVTPDVRS